MISTTTLLLIGTIVISLAAMPMQNIMPESFKRPEWHRNLCFNAYQIWHKRQAYRLFTHGLIHADYWHLIFNMLTLYFFGDFVDECFQQIYGTGMGRVIYLILYITALAVSSSIDLVQYRDSIGYNAVGASGAISAVLFAAIFFNPSMKICLMFIPIPTPGWLFGLLYLAYCYYMAKQQMDNIGHTAHMVGAIYGFMFPLILKPDLINHFVGVLTK